MPYTQLEELENKAIMFISNIRQCYNSSPTLSVHRLPPEVLRMVFHFLIAPPSSLSWISYKGHDKAKSYKQLTRAMLVCRKWHSIAIKTASLWTEIDLVERPSSASCLLERSRAALIRLRANLDETEGQVVKSILSLHGDRVSELELSGPARAQLEAHGSLDISMPKLRQLKLTFYPLGGDTSTRTHFASPERSPSLRALLLSRTLWLPTGVVPNLTHILLKDMKNVDVSLIWNLLCSTPMLEVFEMSSNVGLTVTRGPTPASPLTLPRLQGLTVTGAYTDAVHYLVSRLELPNVTAVSYGFLFAKSGTLLERLLPRSLATHTPTRVTLVIGGDYHCFTAGFQADASTVTISYISPSDEAIIPPFEERRQWPFATFPALLSLAHVTTFRFSSAVWDPDCLLRLGAHFANVTELSLMVTSHGHFDPDKAMELGVALSRALLADDPVVFPKLRSLDVDAVDLPRAFIDVLVPALAKRERDGRRLRLLCVHVGALWPAEWGRDVHEDLKETGLFDNVDGGSSRRSEYLSRRDWDREVRHDMPRAPTHGYW